MENFHSKEFMQVTNVTLMVKDIEKSLAFYQNNIGLKLIKKENDVYALGTHTGHILIYLISNPESTPKMRTTGLYHFALLLPSRRHLGQFIKHMIQTKTGVTGGADHGISEALYLDDPDGNGIEIYSDRLQKDWPDFDNMENLPMDYETLVRNALTTPFNKIPDETIMGHIHLHVSNMDLAKSYFINTLGFESTMEYGPHAAFVSDKGYHHHIGFNVWNGTNIPNTPPNMVGLKSYTLHIPKTMYESFMNRLEAHKVEVKHVDNEVFIYDLNHVKITLVTN